MYYQIDFLTDPTFGTPILRANTDTRAYGRYNHYVDLSYVLWKLIKTDTIDQMEQTLVVQIDQMEQTLVVQRATQ